jgi:hypothetical protein
VRDSLFTKTILVAVRRRAPERYQPDFHTAQIDTVVLAALRDREYTSTERRYLELISLINGESQPNAALLASARREFADAGDLTLRDFGP